MQHHLKAFHENGGKCSPAAPPPRFPFVAVRTDASCFPPPVDVQVILESDPVSDTRIDLTFKRTEIQVCSLRVSLYPLTCQKRTDGSSAVSSPWKTFVSAVRETCGPRKHTYIYYRPRVSEVVVSPSGSSWHDLNSCPYFAGVYTLHVTRATALHVSFTSRFDRNVT